VPSEVKAWEALHRFDAFLSIGKSVQKIKQKMQKRHLYTKYADQNPRMEYSV